MSGAAELVLLCQVCRVQKGTLAYMEDSSFWKVHVGFHGESKGNEGVSLRKLWKDKQSTHTTLTNL